MTISDLRLGKNIRRVTILVRDESGQVTPTVVYEGKSGKKKQTRKLKPVESAVRRGAEAAAATANSYLSRHQNSNRKERDGWLVNMQGNVFKAMRKGSKRMKMNRVITMMQM
jgi:hypothetical protein